MDTKNKVEVHIPEHKCRRGYGDGNSTTMVTLLPNKDTFRCPGCGREFPLEESLNITPECRAFEGNYECSVTEKKLYFNPRRAEVTCINSDCPEKHRCTIGYAGVFKEVIQSAHVDGLRNESGLVNQGSQHSKCIRIKSPPLQMMDSLGLKGFNISKDPLKLKAVAEGILKDDDLMEFVLFGEPRKPRKLGGNIYDIQDDRFLLFHKHEYLTEYKENEPELVEIDEKPSHVCSLIEKSTGRMYIVPKATKNIFGFNFQEGNLYGYFPQKGYELADGDAFKDNTKFVAYKTKDLFPNPKSNSRDKFWGYLVAASDIDDFKALTRRSTRIFSSDDYSGIPKYSQELLWYLKNNNTTKGILEIIDEDFILREYYELQGLIRNHNCLQCDITDFELIDIDEVIKDVKEEFGDDALDEDDEKRIKELYDKFVQFINEYCDGIYGDMENVLNDLDDDVHNPDYINFKRNLDKFRIGDPLQNEYHAYSNYDLIQAHKHKHEMKLVRTASAENHEAITRLRNAGTLKGEDPCKERKAQDVAFDYESEYGSLGKLAENHPHIKSVKIFGDKPQEEWSIQDYERFEEGEDIKEIRSIVIGMKADENDPITRHCLYGEPLPSEYQGRTYDQRTICVSGSRVMSPSLRTYRDEYGYYVTPAINVWKGFFIENKTRLLFARCAKGSDSAAIVAAIEINEYLFNKAQKRILLENKYKEGEITKEEYEEGIIGTITKEQYNEMYITIVIVGHGWYKSIDYNNPGLTAIIDRALNFDGYFISNEPYRIKRGTETIKVPVSYFDERENRLQVLQQYDMRYKSFKTIEIERFHWFDRRLERANKRLVSLGGPNSKLVILCRSEYSGTTNTMNFAIEAGKEVVEITSPTREAPIDWRSENDPIQKGHSDFEYYNEFWNVVVMMVPSSINNYPKWYQMVKNPGKYKLGYNMRTVLNPLGLQIIPKIEVRKVEYKRKPRYVRTIIEEPTIQHKQKVPDVKPNRTFPNAHVVATVPSTIAHYAKWYQTIDAIKSGFIWIGVKSKTYGTIIKHHRKDSFTKRAQQVMSSSKTKTRSKLTEEDLIKVCPELKAYYDNWSNTDSRTWVKTKDNKRLA